MVLTNTQQNLEPQSTNNADLANCMYVYRYESRVYKSAGDGVSMLMLDTTLRTKSEARLAVLARAGQMLSQSLHFHVPSLLSSMLKIVSGQRNNSQPRIHGSKHNNLGCRHAIG